MVDNSKEVTPRRDQVIVRYGEIGLKSPGIRRHLESLLQQHLKLILTRGGLPVKKISRGRGRLFIQTSNPNEVSKKISQVFGVVSSSPVWSTSPTLEAIDETIRLLVPTLLDSHQTFAVVQDELGIRILQAKKLPVS